MASGVPTGFATKTRWQFGKLIKGVG